MKKKNLILIPISIFFILFFVLKTAIAQQCIPAGTNIESATFSIMPNSSTQQTVNIHRVTAPWLENEVTWENFANSFDPFVESFFVVDDVNWKSADITSLVQEWVNGDFQNYGILIEQDIITDYYTDFSSSEYNLVENRPKLEICYSSPAGSVCYTIQRLGIEQETVYDAYIREPSPYLNTGSITLLYTGISYKGNKQSLIKFDIRTCQNVSPGTGTPGFWKNHDEVWPVDSITVGGVIYTKEEAISYLWMPEKGDKTYTIFRALVSAKLNILIGNNDSCIAESISAADNWLLTYGPVSNGIKGSSDAWGEGEPLYLNLDQYNNGLLCAPSR